MIALLPRRRLAATSLALVLLFARPAAAEPGQISLVDRTASSGLASIALRSGAWFAVGVAFTDLDGDRWPDIYIGGSMGDHDALCLNRRDGSFACSNMPLKNNDAVMAIAGGDYDGDGDLDLYVMRQGKNSLLQNDGHARFTDVTDRLNAAGDPAKTTATGTFLDYNGDGRLDLYLGHWNAVINEGPAETARDQLLAQRADGSFADVIAETGINDQARAALAMLAFDYDNDGKQDLYVGNDFGDALLFHNSGGGKFTDVSAQQPADFLPAINEAMGVDAADWDGDGFFDFYVTNSKRPPDTLGSAFYVNRGDGSFASRATELGLLADFGWGVGFHDYDNDGWPDLLVSSDAVPHFFLYQNQGGKSFTEQHLPTGRDLAAQRCVSLAFADYDRDGRMDALVVRLDGTPPVLLHNETQSSNHWLGVHLIGDPQRDPLGADVSLRAGGLVLRRQLFSQSSRGGQNDRRLSFGLGAAATVDSIEVRWPDGAVEHVFAVAADQEVTLHEGRGLVPTLVEMHSDLPVGCSLTPSVRVGLSPYWCLLLLLSILLTRRILILTMER